MRSSLALVAALVPAALAAECSPFELVYARATGEPAASAKVWSKGYGAAGFSLYTNITALIPGATGYAVNYPAAMGTEKQGGADMVKHLTERAKACPDQKYSLGGHSQGSFAVNEALPKLSPDIIKRIVAVTHFGGKECLSSVKGVCSTRPCGLPPKKRGILDRRAMDAFTAKLPECGAAMQMKTCGLGSGSHMGYNADGTYVKEAACFTAAQFQKLGGGKASAAPAAEAAE
ncbi:hypothetical protein BLS_001610 [Venturia inaequalis]|uniref:Cutinase n=1 Tax=Venturia inaequalis TaxID=5025 RepID=A0A8H3UXA3_VENIN|nr:hypothetical protein BLS_001610 [Venturia inaequalis]